ncbi:MAG: DUF3849 domain-containing protein [Oscillospiraceae bacterium]|nr:DUF3849 domain-containing protein [Oscillospiraceae bacterium]
MPDIMENYYIMKPASKYSDRAAYRAERKTNMDCKKAIEDAIADDYDGAHLNAIAAYNRAAEVYGAPRVIYIVAVTVRAKPWDGRFSPKNRTWAEAQPYEADPDAWGRDRNEEFSLETHSAILDGFISFLLRDGLIV